MVEDLFLQLPPGLWRKRRSRPADRMGLLDGGAVGADRHGRPQRVRTSTLDSPRRQYRRSCDTSRAGGCRSTSTRASCSSEASRVRPAPASDAPLGTGAARRATAPVVVRVRRLLGPTTEPTGRTASRTNTKGRTCLRLAREDPKVPDDGKDEDECEEKGEREREVGSARSRRGRLISRRHEAIARSASPSASIAVTTCSTPCLEGEGSETES